jgi:hypothetical protein
LREREKKGEREIKWFIRDELKGNGGRNTIEIETNKS